MKKYRVLQLLTGFHYIHHIYNGFGFKIPFSKYGYFINNKRFIEISDNLYHNCTTSKVY
jgi:hypothetical protein